jgi:hypothetical protein
MGKPNLLEMDPPFSSIHSSIHLNTCACSIVDSCSPPSLFLVALQEIGQQRYTFQHLHPFGPRRRCHVDATNWNGYDELCLAEEFVKEEEEPIRSCQDPTKGVARDGRYPD